MKNKQARSCVIPGGVISMEKNCLYSLPPNRIISKLACPIIYSDECSFSLVAPPSRILGDLNNAHTRRRRPVRGKNKGVRGRAEIKWCDK